MSKSKGKGKDHGRERHPNSRGDMALSVVLHRNDVSETAWANLTDNQKAKVRAFNAKKYLIDSDDSDDEYEDLQGNSGDSSDDLGQFLKKAIEVIPEDIEGFNPNSDTPENGSQYLLSVMAEAKKTPKIVVADVAELEKKLGKVEENSFESYFDAPPAGGGDGDPGPSGLEIKRPSLIAKVDPSVLPGPLWTSEVIKKFAQTRCKIEWLRALIDKDLVSIPLPENVILPEKGNGALWNQFCFGLGSNPVNPEQSQEKKDASSEVTNKIQPEDPPNSEKLPDDLIGAVGGDIPSPTSEEPLPEPKANGISSSSSASESEGFEDDLYVMSDGGGSETSHRPTLSIIINLLQRTIESLIRIQVNYIKSHGWIHARQGEWMYALLVGIQKPLEPETMSDLREFVICCKRHRAFLSTSLQSAVESEVFESSNLKSKLNNLNLFIVLVSEYFGQKDLGD